MSVKFILNLIIILLTGLFITAPVYADTFAPALVSEEGFGPSSLLLIVPVTALLGLIVLGFLQSGKKPYKKNMHVDIEEQALTRIHNKQSNHSREFKFDNKRMQNYLAKPVAKKEYT
ncbi:hypothetical protein [Mucilaginibacter aquatilis]|uniref:Uncharacterized protein n=1 Tax=Mucilaginibacter aquatilis TaxID=1517760 RepID=A0A6I4IHR7_9SPHI|nr:hypothetical protein [Mucilaginibacter aquatilis]MVN93148.1 hypothetical protein [Mucilaginibacter aquatilis]